MALGVAVGSSTASANPIPGPFDVMHLIAYVNFPFNGLLLLLLVEIAYRDRVDLPFGPVSFLLTFFLSVIVITCTGAIIDGVMWYNSSISAFLSFAILVGVTAGLISIRYLGFSPWTGALTALAFGMMNILVWSAGRSGEMSLDVLLANRSFLNLCYVLMIAMTVAFVIGRLRQTRVVTLDPCTGNRGLERIERGPDWERVKMVLSDRSLTELVVFAILGMVIAVLIPMMNEPVM
jgi:hypothetical protein